VEPTSVICERAIAIGREWAGKFRDAAHISNVNASQYDGLFDAAFRSALGAQAGKIWTERRGLTGLRAG